MRSTAFIPLSELGTIDEKNLIVLESSQPSAWNKKKIERLIDLLIECIYLSLIVYTLHSSNDQAFIID